MDCDGEVLNSNPKVFGINDLNFGPQNDFRFAIISADDLEFSPILRTLDGKDVELVQSVDIVLLRSIRRRCGLRWRSFEFESKTFWNK